MNDYPQLLRCDSQTGNNWIKVRTHRDEVKPQRHWRAVEVRDASAGRGKAACSRSTKCAAAADISRRAICECTSGLGKAEKVDLLEIRWPSGQVDTLKNLVADRLYYVKEGGEIVKMEEFGKKER